MLLNPKGSLKGLIDHRLRICLHLVRLICQPVDKLSHGVAIWDAVSCVAVDHEEVPAADPVPNETYRSQRLFQSVGIRVQEDRAMLETFGSLNVGIGHILPMQLSLLLLHLVPLNVIAMAGVDLAKGFHSEEEDQLKVGHTPHQGLTLQGGNETLSWGHVAFGGSCHFDVCLGF